MSDLLFYSVAVIEGYTQGCKINGEVFEQARGIPSVGECQLFCQDLRPDCEAFDYQVSTGICQIFKVNSPIDASTDFYCGGPY